MPRLRRVEQPRRDGRPASRARASRRARRGRPAAPPSRRLADVGEAERAAPAASASASSTASSAAGSCPARSCSSAASRASASRRSCSRPRPASPRPSARARCSTRRARSRRPRSGCGRTGSGCSTGRPASAIRVAAESRGRPDRRAGAIDDRPALLVVDSIQTATVDELDGPAGSVGQVRRVGAPADGAREGATAIAVVLVGHVTKDGSIAGPKTLEHLVDAVLDARGRAVRAALRLLRASKNRFGSTEEVGVFEMGERGLARGRRSRPGRSSPSTTAPAPGSVVAPTPRGQPAAARRGPGARRAGRLRDAAPDGERRRPEPAGAARRRPRPAGRDRPRRATTSTPTSPAACRVDEPGLDLPLALALASSLRDRPVAPGTVAIGEVGLLGELRAVAGLERRLREAARLGFTPGDRARAPAAGGRDDRRRRASRSSRVGDAPRARSRRRSTRSEPPDAWRRSRRDARLATAPRSSGGGPSTPSEARRADHVIRNIRLLGAALGGLVGLGLGRARRRPVRPGHAPSGGVFLIAWVVAWIVVGFAILPYLTIVPAALADPPGPAALDRRVRDRRRRPAASAC